jgi:hypothetical protein
LGSGGRKVAEALSKYLDWPLFDKEIMDVLAKQSTLGFQAEMFEALDEKIQNQIEAVLYGLFGQVDRFIYSYLLPKAILTIAQQDSIILGRAAHLFLPDSLKVRIEASEETRIKNLMQFEGLTEKEAKKQIRNSDKKREDFLRLMINQIPKSRRWFIGRPMYDLQINADRFGIFGTVSIIITAAKERFGLVV